MDEFEYEVDDKGNMQIAKSLDSEEPSHIRFVNCSYCSISIYWIDYNGKTQLYKKLEPLQFFDLNTYTTHPWIFKERITQDRLVVNNKTVFRGPKVQYFWVPTTNSNHIRREVIRIRMPMRSLTRLVMVEIVKALPDENCLAALGLPGTLQNELKSLMILKNQDKS
ncbi:von Hippel-Lindau protein [Arctopsyche grandis]|uniref:von Hippel-Lindau protein n=1 Tax=Arctopsyche grandis TaxID=121162 RepID=UPI00406D788E